MSVRGCAACGGEEGRGFCNLYALTKGQQVAAPAGSAVAADGERPSTMPTSRSGRYADRAIRHARRVMAELAKPPLPAPAGSGTADAPITRVITSRYGMS
jgi:hypothetical protein